MNTHTYQIDHICSSSCWAFVYYGLGGCNEAMASSQGARSNSMYRYGRAWTEGKLLLKLGLQWLISCNRSSKPLRRQESSRKHSATEAQKYSNLLPSGPTSPMIISSVLRTSHTRMRSSTLGRSYRNAATSIGPSMKAGMPLATRLSIRTRQST